MKLQIFDLFGGRKNFNAYLAVILVVVWQFTKWPNEALFTAVGFLGLTNVALVGSDVANRNRPVIFGDANEEAK